MSYINIKIHGIPYGQDKVRGNKSALQKWTQEIINQTMYLFPIKNACLLKATFLLPPDKYPKDFPYGSDLDNLLKRFMDALENTIFSEARGVDSCVISINAIKTKVSSYEEAGVLLEILPVSI